MGEDADQAFDDAVRVWQPAPQWRQFMREILVARDKRLPLELGS